MKKDLGFNLSLAVSLFLAGAVFAIDGNWWALLFLAILAWVVWEFIRYRERSNREYYFYRELDKLHSDEMYRLSSAMTKYSSVVSWEDGHCICGQEEHTEKCQLFRETTKQHLVVLDAIKKFMDDHPLY